MTPKFYGKDLAQYKLERAREELDTAQLLLDNQKIIEHTIQLLISIRIMFIREYFHVR